MTKARSTDHPHPDLSALLDKSAEDYREPLTWIKRFGILPWLHRNDAVCQNCGGTYPCITHRYATQLLSAGRYTIAKPQHDDHDNDGDGQEPNPN